MRTHQLHEKLIQPPRQLLADIIHHAWVGALWIIRDRFTPKVRADFPEHWKAFQEECARRGFKFPKEKFSSRMTKGCSIQVLKLEPDELPDNYRHLQADNPEVNVLINWKGEINTGDMLAGWVPKSQKIIINAWRMRELEYPSKYVDPSDISFILRTMRESLIHELRHATQSMLIAKKDPSQIERLPGYTDFKDDYYASPIEFDPQIGSAIHEFVEHYKMLTVYAKRKPNLRLWISQAVGAKPAAIGNGYGAFKIFLALKKRGDEERYKIAVKKFFVGVLDALKEEGLLESKVNESFYLTPNNQDAVFQAFKRSYEEETGAAWSEGKFLSRARNWTFYGDDKGFVAVREQRSGMKKLVGVAGDPKSILKGLAELQADGGPIWGAVSAPLAQMAKKRGMIVPHLYPGGAFFIKALVKVIPSYVFGGYEPVVTKDGGVQFSYDDVGTHTKYLIGNKEYFVSALKLPGIVEKIKEVPGLMSAIRMMGLTETLKPRLNQKDRGPH